MKATQDTVTKSILTGVVGASRPQRVSEKLRQVDFNRALEGAL